MFRTAKAIVHGGLVYLPTVHADEDCTAKVFHELGQVSLLLRAMSAMPCLLSIGPRDGGSKVVSWASGCMLNTMKNNAKHGGTLVEKSELMFVPVAPVSLSILGDLTYVN